MKSRLRLQANQKEVWQKLEDAAAPAVDSLLLLCTQLPDRPVERLDMPQMIDFTEKQLSAQAAFLRAVREPLRALFETLSSEQRAALEHPLPPR